MTKEQYFRVACVIALAPIFITAVFLQHVCDRFIQFFDRLLENA